MANTLNGFKVIGDTSMSGADEHRAFCQWGKPDAERLQGCGRHLENRSQGQGDEGRYAFCLPPTYGERQRREEQQIVCAEKVLL